MCLCAYKRQMISVDGKSKRKEWRRIEKRQTRKFQDQRSGETPSPAWQTAEKAARGEQSGRESPLDLQWAPFGIISGAAINPAHFSSSYRGSLSLPQVRNHCLSQLNIYV